MSLALSEACNATTFAPVVFGAEILTLDDSVVTNYSASVPDAFRFTAPSVELRNATFCNVTLSYTYPGQNDEVIVEAWLPLEGWNGRFQAVGGGGWVAGRSAISYGAMGGALADGFATITTDAGLGDAMDASEWALTSPGNINWSNLHNLASITLNDEAIIGKSLIEDIYGKKPDFSYWNGCSQGGRQGLMLAQRFPNAYDGIAAGAPAIHWTEFVPSVQWPQQVMNELDEYPFGCEIDAITAAAVEACDGLDGVVDGVISHVDDCLSTFDPFSIVGKSVQCAQINNTATRVSHSAAAIVSATWRGMSTTDGKRIWHGLNPGSDLTGNRPTLYSQPGVAATANCSTSGCIGAPNILSLQWLQLFIARAPGKDMSNLTRADFIDLVHAGRQQFTSIIGTADPDLSKFKDAGGKLISFHGLADGVIPPKGTEQYYNEVTAALPNIHEFYRYYEVPGLGHCFGGASGQPTQLFQQLQAWVENETAPERTPVTLNVGGETHHRILCPYPKRPDLGKACRDPTVADCWSCTAGRPSLALQT